MTISIPFFIFMVVMTPIGAAVVMGFLIAYFSDTRAEGTMITGMIITFVAGAFAVVWLVSWAAYIYVYGWN